MTEDRKNELFSEWLGSVILKKLGTTKKPSDIIDEIDDIYLNLKRGFDITFEKFKRRNLVYVRI